MTPTDYEVCFVTVGDKKTADLITEGLLRDRLAACVSAVPGVQSAYTWKGRIEKSEEILLIIKTRRTLREDVVQFVKKHHTYETPETIFLTIQAGSQAYLDWLGANTAFTTNIPKEEHRETRKDL